MLKNGCEYGVTDPAGHKSDMLQLTIEQFTVNCCTIVAQHLTFRMTIKSHLHFA